MQVYKLSTAHRWFILAVLVIVLNHSAFAQSSMDQSFVTEADAELALSVEARMHQLTQLLERLILHKKSAVAKACAVGQVEACQSWHLGIERDFAASQTGRLLIRVHALYMFADIARRYQAMESPLSAATARVIGLYYEGLRRRDASIAQLIVSARERFKLIKGSSFIVLDSPPSEAAIDSRAGLIEAGLLAELDYLLSDIRAVRNPVHKD